jgi:K+-sensing histidine kinase KdpD
MASDASKQTFYEKRLSKQKQEVEEALKVKSQFVANVTHELRTPVNGILGNTKELLEMEQDPAALRLLNLVERGCNDMHAIINNVLDFSKLEAGKFVLERRKFHFRNMIDYVKSNHINKITEKGLELFVTVSPEIPEYIVGDELRIVQILNNLLSNACKFTSVGKIAVEVVMTSCIDNRIELFFMVIDTGIGIDKADQDKLFQSFSQVEASISRKYGGTGLGLNISKQLVELMDGNIRVESDKGKGTMFSFHIWVDIPEEEQEIVSTGPKSTFEFHEPNLADFDKETESVRHFGEPDNLEEIKKKMSKLILSVEMDNWDKAEMFMDTIKQLTEDAPREVKSPALRLKMAVQKGDYEKTVKSFEKMQEALEEYQA